MRASDNAVDQVSVASLMMGVGGGSEDLRTLLLSGMSGLVGGALSMAAGEFISVYSQKDAEESDIAKERAAQEHVRRPSHTCTMGSGPQSPAAVGAHKCSPLAPTISAVRGRTLRVERIVLV